MKPLLLPLTVLLLPVSLLAANEHAAAEATAADHGKSAVVSTAAAINEDDLRRYVTRLASEEYEGRGTGDRGERMATSYLAAFFAGLELRPEGDDGSYFQNFEFRAGMALRGENALSLVIDEPVGLVRRFTPGEHYQPLSISTAGDTEAGVVFAGFGIETENYNSFDSLAVEGKWLVVFRGNPKERRDLARFGPLVAKANLAKKKGAAGIIFVKGTNPAISSDLIAPGISVGGRDQILPALTITDRLAAALLTGQDGMEGLQALFSSYHDEKKVTGYPLPFRVKAAIGIATNNDPGRNVIARLVTGQEPAEEAIVIGAHIDHLGYGNRGGTRAKGEDARKIHFGADDNASGVAAMMEVVRSFADRKKAGQLNLKRDLIFAGWSGEELGLHGSRHYVAQAKEDGGKLEERVVAYVNLDMVGKLGDRNLNIQGTGSSQDWPEILDSLAEIPGMNTKRSPNPNLPTDTTPFYNNGVPVLAAFTGLHDDYHTPNDTVDKIDFVGLEKVSHYLQNLTEVLANRPEAPAYQKFQRPRGGPRVRIGVRPEDADQGVRLAEVTADSAAARAGLQEGDVLTKLDGKKVENTEGLLNILREFKAGQEYEAVLIRGEQEVVVKLVPEAR